MARGVPPGKIKWPHDSRERREWKQVMAATEAEWRASYERRPTRASEVLARMVLEAERDEPHEASQLQLVA